MRRCDVQWMSFVSLVCLALTAAPLRAEEQDQQIPVEVLKQIKAATTLVKVRFQKSEGTGTGFLVETEGTTGYLVTNVHVIAPLEVLPPKILVTPQSTFDVPSPVWTPMMAPPRPSSKRGPTSPTRPGTKRPGMPLPNTSRPGMPRSPIVRSQPGYRPQQPGYRGPSRSTIRVYLIPGRIQVLLPESIDVVFDSGRKTERTVSATVAGIDLDHNLAVLKIQDVVDLPKPIKPPEELDLLETTPVYIFGFPFGQQLSTGKGNPAMTVGTGIISSIRDDEDGDTQVVQIDGDINPGNSGGPVVDATGQLIGLAVAGISKTNIGLAIPATDLTNMLAGRAGDLKVMHSTLEPGVAKIEVELKLIDPLHKISKAAIRYRATDELTSPIEPDKDGNFLPLPGAKVLDLKIDGQKATGSVTIKLDDKTEKKYTMQAVYTQAKKAAVILPPTEPYAVKFEGATAANSVTILAPSTSRPSLDGESKAAASGGYTGVPNMTKPENPSGNIPRNQVGETRTVPLRSLTTNDSQAEEQVKVTLFKQGNSMMPNCLAWSSDGTSFYYLESSGDFHNAVIRRVSFPDGRELAEWKVNLACTWLSLSSEGVVVTCGGTETVKVLDPITLEVRRSITVPNVIRAISAPALDFAFGATKSVTGFQVIDLKAGKVVEECTPDPQHGGRFRSASFSQDGRFLYFPGTDGSIVRWRVSGRKLTFDDETAPLILDDFSGLSISADGEYVAAPCGGIGNRLLGSGPVTRSKVGANANYVFGPGKMQTPQWVLGQGEAPQAIGFDLQSGLIYGFNWRGKIVLFDIDGARIKEFTFSNQSDSPSKVRQILVHPDGRKLVILEGGEQIGLNAYKFKLWCADLTPPASTQPSTVAIAPQVAVIPPSVAVETPPAAVTPPPVRAARPAKNVTLRSLTKAAEGGMQSEEQVKVTCLVSGKSSIPNCVTWSSDGTSFYYVQQSENPGFPSFSVVRRVSFPDGIELAEWKVQFICSWLSLSSEGLVVTSPSTKVVWVLDPVTLETRRSISVPGLGRAVSAPALDFAFASAVINSKLSFEVLDLTDGKIVGRLTEGELKHPGNYGGALMSQDGKRLFYPGAMGNIVRFRIAGRKLVFDDETDPIILNEFHGLSVSDNGEYVAAPCRDMGNWMVGQGPGKKAQTAVFGNYVFGPGKMQKPHCVLGQGEAPQAIAFDLKSGLFYGFNSGSNNPIPRGKVILFNLDGVRTKEFEISEDRMTLVTKVRQILVHSDGRKLIILEDDRTLWFADLTSATSTQPPAAAVATGSGAIPTATPPVAASPATMPPTATPPVIAAPVARTRKWTDASGVFSVEAELIEIKDGKVYLRRADGKEISIPVDKLSKADQQYVDTIADKNAAKP
jgi:S1-C subfamily serine protease